MKMGAPALAVVAARDIIAVAPTGMVAVTTLCVETRTLRLAIIVSCRGKDFEQFMILDSLTPIWPRKEFLCTRNRFKESVPTEDEQGYTTNDWLGQRRCTVLRSKWIAVRTEAGSCLRCRYKPAQHQAGQKRIPDILHCLE